MAANIITLDVSRIDLGVGSAPGTVTGIDVDSGQQYSLKGWSDVLGKFESGKTFRCGWYLGREYNGTQDMLISKHSVVQEIPNASRLNTPGNVIDDLPPLPDEKQAQPPQKSPERAVGAPTGQQTTPQGVMSASRDLKDRTITCLAVMKSVIESGGDEADFDRWMRKLNASVGP